MGIFCQTIEMVALDEFVIIQVKHGVGCLEKICSLTESDFEEMELNIRQRTKCILAAQQIKDHCLNVLKSIIMLQSTRKSSI